jgi:hypothetical protein
MSRRAQLAAGSRKDREVRFIEYDSALGMAWFGLLPGFVALGYRFSAELTLNEGDFPV